VAHRREVHQCAEKDETVPDGMGKRYHSIALEEHDARDVDGATYGHLMHSRMFTLPSNNKYSPGTVSK